MARNPNADTIKNNTNRRRSIQSDIANLRKSKQQQLKSLDSLIKNSSSVNQRRTYRSQKANIRESFNRRIENLRDRAKSILEENKRLRRR